MDDSKLIKIAAMMERDAREQATKHNEPKKKWAVLQCETGYGDGNGDASVFCTIFDDRDAALKYINDVIRNEWTTTVTIPTEKDEFNEELLADHKGFTSPEGSIKWSDVHYSEDGEFAWYQRDGIIKKIGLTEVKPNGERFYI